jgi:hypothetical protein
MFEATSPALICWVVPTPTYEPTAFYDVDMYKAWHSAMREEI